MKVTVLGCGRWGGFHAWYQATVLGNDVLVWGRDDEFYREISTTRKNEYLTLPESVKFTTDLKKALGFAEHIIISVWAQSMPEVAKQIGAQKPKGKTFTLCMKGLIDATGERLSDVLAAQIDKSNHIAVWVGPGHVQELAAGQPNIMIISGSDAATVADVADKFKSSLVRLYQSDDLVGCEIGAAAKNVLGLVAGVLDGIERTSLKGALMARGTYEVAKLIDAMGGQKLTAYGMAHLGDFEATLFSQNSNNRRYGEKLVRGEHETHVAEGVPTSKALYNLAARYHVEMPICRACYQMLHEKRSIDDVFAELFTRDNAKEFRF